MTVSEYPIAFAGAEDYTPEIIFPALTRAVCRTFGKIFSK